MTTTEWEAGWIPRAAWSMAGALVAAAIGVGGVQVVNAVTGPPRQSLVSIDSCRLFDTRPGTSQVGPRRTALGPAQQQVFKVRGANGKCTIPSSATAVLLNLTMAPTSRPSFGWESLTATELLVVECVADGLTNAEIAARLYMGRRTVESHLAHVYTKVQVGSHLELAGEVAARRTRRVAEP